MNPWLDSTVRAYLRHYGVSEKPVVWEIGSRDGDDGVDLAKQIYTGRDEWFWSNATVVCFEPNPDQAEVIRKRYPEAETYEFAASNATGEAEFIIYHGDAGAVGSSSLNLTWKGFDLEGHIIRVKTARLENFIKDKEIIDIMKIDVEGHSLQVLEGLGNKLKQIRVIHVETEEWSGTNKKVEKFMKERGWTLVDVMEQYGGMPDQVWVNSGVLAG